MKVTIIGGQKDGDVIDLPEFRREFRLPIVDEQEVRQCIETTKMVARKIDYDYYKIIPFGDRALAVNIVGPYAGAEIDYTKVINQLIDNYRP